MYDNLISSYIRIMNTNDNGQIDESDTMKHAGARQGCGMRTVDRLQIWSDALRASGISHRSIDSKLSLAMELFRRRKSPL